jgi:hypothetical protein
MHVSERDFLIKNKSSSKQTNNKVFIPIYFDTYYLANLMEAKKSSNFEHFYLSSNFNVF